MMKYIHELGNLFEDVQLNNVFPDNKTFPDCTPKKSLHEIRSLYEIEKTKAEFNLKTFVSENFNMPEGYDLSYHSNSSQSAAEHIEELWNVLTRTPKEGNQSSLLPLPNTYVVPGGRFREVYYWDSYFTMLGLQVSRRIDLIENMVNNFAYLLDMFGHIPNGNRAYYVGRSQPPFFALMVDLLASEKERTATLLHYLPHLETEYKFWMNERAVWLDKDTVLNHYSDKNDMPRPESFKEDVELSHISTQKPSELFRNLRAAAESGWDFSSRWFRKTDAFDTIHTTDIIAVDLNCLLVFLEQLLAETYYYKNDLENSEKYGNLAQKRKKAIQQFCWNEEKGFYFDYDFVEKTQTSVYSLAGVFPLFFKVATEEQAKKVAEVLEKNFLKAGGLLTTTEFTGQQWDAPNGWAPLQWMAYQGLKNYSFYTLANEIKKRWVNLNLKVYTETGKMTEKYNVSDLNVAAGGGEYPNQDGFGWTNGVLLRMLNEK